MSESYYRRNPEGDAIKIVQNRRGLLNDDQTTYGRSVQDRNPCFVYITGHNMSCGGGGSSQIPRNRDTWEKQYGSFKPKPQLESAKIESSGEQFLARRVSGVIRCYTVDDFLNVQKHFLLPGNEIDIRFGYKGSWGISQPTKELKGFKVATFNFNTNSEGQWLCSFSAVSSATAIKNLDMQSVVCNGCNAIGGSGPNGNAGPLKYLTGIDKERHAVKGVAQLIAADCQKNGETSIDEMQDGEVITSFLDYNPGSYDNSAAIVVYNGDHIRDLGDKVAAWIGGLAKRFGYGDSEVESANNQVFVSLGYIVNRIINCQLMRSLTCQVAHEREKFNKLKVEFHPVYSKSKVADGITSGDPVHCLLLGKANYKNDKGQGKDFDSDCKNLGAVTAYSGAGNIKLQNILLHRDVIIAAFTAATKTRESESDQTDIKDTKEEVINISDFFEKIADEISSCTGGAIALRLVENPDNLKTLIVVDQNYGVSEQLQCVVFDPIDGDGNTRSCDVQSNVGSQEYKAAMFVGASKKGDSVSALRDCSKELDDHRGLELEKAKNDKFCLIMTPGNLGSNNFAGTEINALKSVMGRIHRNNIATTKNETVHYPGCEMNIEINGVWGFQPGNAISTTQIPSKWRDQLHSYFMVTSVQHDFVGSDWKTTMRGILAYYNNIKYVPL